MYANLVNLKVKILQKLQYKEIIDGIILWKF